MDGNGRWASQRGLPRHAGHKAGTENIRRILRRCVALGIKYVTLYAFSTENWNRPEPEIAGLFRLLADVIEQEAAELHREGVRVMHLGRPDGVPGDLIRAIRRAVELTSRNSRLVLNIAWNYGGRAEIVDAVRKLVENGLPADLIDEDAISNSLYTAGQPDPDLVIRTAGEMRLSNFLIWQANYAEYYSTSTLWPDFGGDELLEAVKEYSARQRKFGGVVS